MGFVLGGNMKYKPNNIYNEDCLEAQAMNKSFVENGIILDDNSGGAHIPYWMTILNQFKKIMGVNEHV